MIDIKELPLKQHLSNKSFYKEICNYYSKEYFKNSLINEIIKKCEEGLGEKAALEIKEFLTSETIIIPNLTYFLYASPQDTNSDNILFQKNPVNIEKYVFYIISYIKKRIAEGTDKIEFTQLLFDLTYVLQNTNQETLISNLFQSLKNILYACMNFEGVKVTFRVLDKNLFKCVATKYQIKSRYYYHIYYTLKCTLKELKRDAENLDKKPTIPNIIILRSTRLITKLENPLNQEEEDFLAPTDADFFGDEEYLFDFLPLKLEVPSPFGIKELPRRFKKEYPFIKVKTFDTGFITDEEEIYIVNNFFINNPLSHYKEAEIDMSKVSLKFLELTMFHVAFLLKLYNPTNELPYRITLMNLKEVPNRALLSKLSEVLKKIRNVYSNNFYLELQFKPPKDTKDQLQISETPNYITIISDIHADYNHYHPPLVKTYKSFNINCGDTSGGAQETINWIKRNIRFGVFTHGNHLGYGDETPIEDQIQLLKETFPLDSEVSYLNNSFKEYNGIIFIGACLYTNFELYGTERKELYAKHASYNMNDFKYPRRRDKGVIRRLTPDDYTVWYKESVRYISKISRKYAHTPVVVLTHFAPLPFSINDEYTGSPLNPAFANDLRNFIGTHPNIVLWCHGHMHNSADYLYNNTRIICSPYGYYHERDKADQEYPKTAFTFDEIKNRVLKKEGIPTYFIYNWDGRRIIH